jgi:uncharacterized protein YkwD
VGRLLALIGALALACASRPAARKVEPAAARPSDATATAAERGTDDPLVWQDSTFSPRLGPSSNPELDPLRGLCAGSDAALDRVAARIAVAQRDEPGVLDVAELTFQLRAEGCPYVWPRAWSLIGHEAGPDLARARMQRWLDSFGDGGERRRCGVAALRDGGSRDVVAAVAADVLAELYALPTRVRVGQWLDVHAELLVAANAAKVIVLGPRGTPRSVPTELSGGRVFARFAADSEGAWLVQVLADVEGGPRQVAEAVMFAGVSPDPAYVARPAPGESSQDSAGDPRTALELMINGARASEGRARVRRTPELDELAQLHAEAMRDAGRIAHDLGRGDPSARVEARGLSVRATAENVARASSLRGAHRALWSSPSHRQNLLEPRFDAIGIGVARDQAGGVWVCELFADL